MKTEIVTKYAIYSEDRQAYLVYGKLYAAKEYYNNIRFSKHFNTREEALQYAIDIRIELFRIVDFIEIEYFDEEE